MNEEVEYNKSIFIKVYKAKASNIERMKQSRALDASHRSFPILPGQFGDRRRVFEQHEFSCISTLDELQCSIDMFSRWLVDYCCASALRMVTATGQLEP